MKILALSAFAMLGMLISSPARAEMVAILHSAKISVGTETMSGYLVLPYKANLDVATPEGLAYIRGLSYQPSVFESIELTAKFSPDYGPFWFSTKKPRQIDNKKVRGVTALKWPLNGREYGAIALVTRENADLLKKVPLAFCKGKIWDGDFWLSYNPKVTEEQLNDLCNRDFEHRPSDAEQQAILKKGNVVHFTFAAHD